MAWKKWFFRNLMLLVNQGVTLAEGQIDMSSTISAGTASFQITNVSTIEHSLEIEGVATYEVYYPVDNYREEGMSLMLMVE